jgi:hypothetical protein
LNLVAAQNTIHLDEEGINLSFNELIIDMAFPEETTNNHFPNSLIASLQFHYFFYLLVLLLRKIFEKLMIF